MGEWWARREDVAINGPLRRSISDQRWSPAGNEKWNLTDLSRHTVPPADEIYKLCPRSSTTRTHTHTHTHTKHTHPLTNTHFDANQIPNTNVDGCIRGIYVLVSVVIFTVCPRASKQRRKADRMVLECQEQAYWLINRPPVGLSLGFLFSSMFFLFYSTLFGSMELMELIFDPINKVIRCANRNCWEYF